MVKGEGSGRGLRVKGFRDVKHAKSNQTKLTQTRSNRIKSNQNQPCFRKSRMIISPGPRRRFK